MDNHRKKQQIRTYNIQNSTLEGDISMDTVIAVIFVFIVAFIIAFMIIKDKKFKETTYHKITKNSYYATKLNTQNYGEYKVYKQIREVEKVGGRLLFDVMLPKEDGTYACIDILLISFKGIFVMQSYNLGGNFYGDDKLSSWTFCKYSGDEEVAKTIVKNPIVENEECIKLLRPYVVKHCPIYQMVVFSNDANFSGITNQKNISLCHLKKIGDELCKYKLCRDLSLQDLEDIYKSIFPFSQISVKTEDVVQTLTN